MAVHMHISVFVFCSGGKACRRHSPRDGHPVRPGEERGKDIAADSLEPLP